MVVTSFSVDTSRYLLDLYTEKYINRKRGLADVINDIKADSLVEGYRSLQAAAPSRRSRQLSYLVESHDGTPSTGAKTTRREEHLALALWNDQSEGLGLPDGSTLQLIDYQVPLKARRRDAGIGKVDLLGLINNSACVVELKVAANSGNSDTPLRAFLEAFAYCAIVEANMADIRAEITSRQYVGNILDRPALVVLAPDDYWADWSQTAATGDWWPALQQLAGELKSSLDLESRFLALTGAEFKLGLNGTKPCLLNECSVVEIDQLVGGYE